MLQTVYICLGKSLSYGCDGQVKASLSIPQAVKFTVASPKVEVATSQVALTVETQVKVPQANDSEQVKV